MAHETANDQFLGTFNKMQIERPEPLSGKNEGSYAYLTIRDRMPVILTKVIDGVHRKATAYTKENNQEYAQDAKNLVAKLSKMNYEMKTNKSLTKVEDTKDDVELWNKFLEKTLPLDSSDKIAWFNIPWLTSETFLYRKIYEACALSKYHQDFDPFQDQKQASFNSQQDNMTSLATILVSFLASLFSTNSDDSTLKLYFETILQFCLWGNKFDLSVSSGDVLAADTQNLASNLASMKKKILDDDSEQVWIEVQKQGSSRIDFILDNAGFELFSDLCLAELLLASKKASVIHLHVKDIPWFVSDTTKSDLYWTLNELKKSDVDVLSQLALKWLQRIQSGSFVIRNHLFWTLCHDYSHMKTISSDLYHDLSKSKLIFFKGDLNYRKLVGDRNWPYTTHFSDALCGFCPAPLCALRTIKAEVVVGLEKGIAEKVKVEDKDWMISGVYAVISMS